MDAQRASSSRDAADTFKKLLRSELDNCLQNVMLAFYQATCQSGRDRAPAQTLGQKTSSAPKAGGFRPISEEEEESEGTATLEPAVEELMRMVNADNPMKQQDNADYCESTTSSRRNSLGSMFSQATTVVGKDGLAKSNLGVPSSVDEEDDHDQESRPAKEDFTECAWHTSEENPPTPGHRDERTSSKPPESSEKKRATTLEGLGDEDAVKVLDVWLRGAGSSKGPSVNMSPVSRTTSWISSALVGVAVNRVHSELSDTAGSLLDIDEDEDDEDGGGFVQRLLFKMDRFVIHPNAKAAILWEFISLAWISWDVLMVPFQTFDARISTLRIVMLWIISLYWTMDIPLSFFVGFTTIDGTMNTSFSMVAKRYVLKRFPLDVLLVICSWTVLVMEMLAEDDENTLLKDVSKSLSVVQLLRLHRLVHLWRLAEKMFIQVRGEARLLVVYMCLLVGAFVLIIHLSGCMWHWVSDGEWAGSDDALADVYIRSIHCVLALFVGEHVMQPRNFGQRLFMVLMLLFGFIISAAFVGSLTTAMTRLQLLARQRSALFASLNRFLADHQISGDLALRINRNARHALAMQQLHIQENDVQLLSYVSAPLRAELHYEIYSHHLLKHPFLRLFNYIRPRSIQSICDTAVTESSLSKGDVLFSASETPERPCMFVLRVGRLHYSSLQNDQAFFRQISEERKFNGQAFVEPDDFVSEAALWAHWQYQGTMAGAKESQLLLMDAVRFGRIMRKTEMPHTRRYAVKFVQRLNNLSHCSDIGLGIDELRRLSCRVFEEEDEYFQPPFEWNITRTSRRRSTKRKSTSRTSRFSVASVATFQSGRRSAVSVVGNLRMSRASVSTGISLRDSMAKITP